MECSPVSLFFRLEIRKTMQSPEINSITIMY